MKYTSNALNILAIKSYKRIGKEWMVRNLKGHESEQKLVSLLNEKSKQIDVVTINDFENRKKQFVSGFESLDACCEDYDGVITLGDENFPKYRGTVRDSAQPVVLFYKGDISLLDTSNLNVTVIGLLDPDKTVESIEKVIIAEIIKHGATIVSGLSLGCETIAHKVALEKGGKTIAFLPSRLNNVWPEQNKNLAAEIVEKGGLLVTEHYEDFSGAVELSCRYSEREKLEAMFCDAIVLAASYSQNSATQWGLYNQKLDCSARLAMDYAKEYGIKRAVIYDEAKHAKNPMFDLNRQLLDDDREVIRIDSENMTKTVEKLVSKPTKNA
jgi:DNA processing protein